MTPEEIGQAFRELAHELTDEQIETIIAYADRNQISINQAITNIILIGKEARARYYGE